MELITVNKENCIVGEGPMWDVKTNVFMFLDIQGKCVYKHNFDLNTETKIELPQQIGCMAITEDGKLLVALEDGVYFADDSGEVTLAHKPIKIKGRRFNDGKVGPDGAFYLGTTDDFGKGAFYRLKDGILTELFDGCGCSNGLDWTVDEKLMYYIDTKRQMIELFDFNKQSGSLSNRRKFMDIPKEWGLPDGMTLDTDDNLWVALWDGNAVIQIDKNTKEVINKITVPAKKASCPVFGGEKMKELFITTAAVYEDLKELPAAGNTFKVLTDTKGKSMYYYKG